MLVSIQISIKHHPTRSGASVVSLQTWVLLLLGRPKCPKIALCGDPPTAPNTPLTPSILKFQIEQGYVGMLGNIILLDLITTKF